MPSVNGTDLNAKRAQVAAQVKCDILTATQDADNDAQRISIGRSFISDTITAPTTEMYAYALKASVGDDVYHEATTSAFEAHMAQLTGKEAALFFSSGTQSNQIALRTHLTQPPYAVLCDERAHINQYEAGGTAFHSGAHQVGVQPSNGHHLTLEDVESRIVLSEDVHVSPTRIISLENTLNGTIFPQDEIIRISKFAHSNGVKMHLDGARLWHVAAETGTSVKELCEPFDSVSLCFSKGLGAPVGTILVGNAEFIRKAKWFRKLFGGGMRQIGVLTASCAYALNNHFPLLPAVHALAQRIEQGLVDLGAVIWSSAETCMVFYDPSPLGLEYGEIADRGAALPRPLILGGSRLVVHIQTSTEAAEDFLELIKTLAEEKKAAGFVYVKPAKNVNGARSIYVRRKSKV
ncbi:pyridoxal phosphate-dependent transferase [Pterulicium gracile]|uniref:Pyridoxal phosphate-dependent transferase n=1 Tax=Pterulicium gracile TaxID=1884261 RepID=A0A5C3QWY4_9AGAR|nr:pyridoxal phosphate-dependent transferase [Pterula gracilis]